MGQPFLPDAVVSLNASIEEAYTSVFSSSSILDQVQTRVSSELLSYINIFSFNLLNSGM